MTVAEAEITVSGSLTASRLEKVRVGSTAQPRAGSEPAAAPPDVTVKRLAKGCNFSGSLGTVKLAKVTDSLTASGIKSLVVDADCSGQLDVTAKSVRTGSVVGNGEIRSDDFHSGGEVTARDGALRVVAKTALVVEGAAHGATLFCRDPDSELVLSRGGDKRRMHVNEPEVTARDVKNILTRIGQSAQKIKSVPVRNCTIDASGAASLFDSVMASQLRAGGRAVIAGDLDLRGGDAEDSDAEAQSVGGSPEAFVSEAPTCTAGELIVNGTVTQGSEQRIEVDTGFSADTLVGGAVIVNDLQAGYFVAKCTESAKVAAGRLGVVEPPTTCELRAHTLMNLVNGASPGNQLRLHGDGAFGAQVESELVWEPTGSSVCDLRNGAHNISVESSAADPHQVPELRVGHGGILGKLGLKGRLLLTVGAEGGAESGGRHKVRLASPLWEEVVLNTDAHLAVAAEDANLGPLHLDADATISRTADSEGTVAVQLARQPAPRFELSLNPKQGIRIEASPTDTRVIDGSDCGPPRVGITGGITEIATQLVEVVCRRDGQAAPTLQVPANGGVSRLSGEFRLALLRGRITGVPSHEQAGRNPDTGRMHSLKSKIARYWWRVSGGRTKGRLTGRAPDPSSRILAVVDPPAADSGRTAPLAGGQLIGVDVTRLEFPDLPALEHLHVFDPDGDALMDHASAESLNRPERAQRLKMLAEIVSQKANSGATRSAVLWAAARAHHTAVDRGHRIERAARRVHRCLGYGYRPWPPAITYVATLLGLSTLLTLTEPELTCAEPDPDSSFIEAPYHYGQQVLRVLLLPVTLLRLEIGGAATYAPIGCHAAWHTLAFAVTGTLLVFLVLAVRNYLRAPNLR